MKFFYVIVAISFLKAVTAAVPVTTETPAEPALSSKHPEIPASTCFLLKIEPDITAALKEGLELCKCFKKGDVEGCDQYKDVVKNNLKLNNALNSLCDHIINPSNAASVHNQSCVCDTTSCKVPPVVLPPTTLNDTAATTTAKPDKCNKAPTDAAEKGTTKPDNECSHNKTSTEHTTVATGGTSNSSSTPAAITSAATTPAATTPAATTPAATTPAATPNTTSTTVSPTSEASSTTEKKPEPSSQIQEKYPLSSILWSVFGSLIAGFLLAVVLKMIYNRFRKRSYGTGHGA